MEEEEIPENNYRGKGRGGRRERRERKKGAGEMGREEEKRR